jgi:hypothetical protein
MTREAFIRKWLANPEKQYDEHCKNEMRDDLDKVIEYTQQQLNIHAVSKSIAIEYAEFCIRCDREKLPLLCLDDYIKKYCH